jgi:ATP-dependent Clp protease adaptor protein ClpS
LQFFIWSFWRKIGKMCTMAQQTPSAPTQPIEQESSSTKSSAATSRVAKPSSAQKQERKELPPFNVVLLNDDDHSYPYVVEMLCRLFGHSEQFAYQIARTVDNQGRAIVLTTHKERAEFKRDQIRGFGSDPRIASSSCSMGAVIEPAEQA